MTILPSAIPLPNFEKDQVVTRTDSVNSLETMLATPFQSLDLTIPRDHSILLSIFSLLLNLDDANLIITRNHTRIGTPSPTRSSLLDNVFVPGDIWLRNIPIKDVAIKNNIINEINQMLDYEFNNEHLQFEDITLNYYSKLLMAYKVYDIPGRMSNSSELSYELDRMGIIHDEEEQDMYSMTDTDSISDPIEPSFYRTVSNDSIGSFKMFSKKARSSTKRISSMLLHPSKSFDFSTSTVALPALTETNGSSSTINGYSPTKIHSHSQSHSISHGQNHSITHGPNISHNSYPFPISHNTHSQSHNSTPSYTRPHSHAHTPSNGSITGPENTLSSILSKSKLYSRVKKKRESAGSIASTGSRSSTAPPSRPISAHKMTTTTTRSPHDSQRQSNDEFEKLKAQRQTYEYYMTLNKLHKNCTDIIKRLNQMSKSDAGYKKFTRFIEFIEKHILKFLVIDLMTMVTTYCKLKARNFNQI
ncbi:uncharacterized protein SPAPADRAFT_63654, partial [Spathaspora passalidarum NRRL Y-27907]